MPFTVKKALGNLSGAYKKFRNLVKEEEARVVLSEAEKEKIKAAFKHFDTNHDDHIDKEEVIAVFEQLLGKKPSKTQLEHLFEEVDTNHDLVISFDEFEAMMTNRQAKMKAYRIMFQKYDTNQDGELSREELANVSFLSNGSVLSLILVK